AARTSLLPPSSMEDVAAWSGAGAIVLGASTGGPPAIQLLVSTLPRDFPLPILVVQHMPGRFTRAFAERLDACSALPVREAEDGDRLDAGTVLVAPGGRRAESRLVDGAPAIAITRGAPQDLHVPSLDVVAISAA